MGVQALEVVEAPFIKDVTDWIEAGHTAVHLNAIVDQTPIYQLATSPRDLKQELNKGFNRVKCPAISDPAKAEERAKKILKDREPPGEFKLDSMPDVIQQYVREICSRTNADPISVLVAILSSMSAILGKRAYIPDGVYFNRLYGNIWAFVQNSSGSFKTTALNKGCRSAWKKAEEIQQAVEQLKKEKISTSLLSGPEAQRRCKEIDQEIKELNSKSPVLPNKASGEGLLELLSYGMGGLIICSELGEWLENLGKTHNQGLKALFTDLYDVPQQYSYMTRGGGNMLILRPFISICGMSTPQWIKDNINLSDVGSGFFARFLIFTPPQKRVVPPALPKIQTPFDDSAELEILRKLESIKSERHFLLTDEAREAFESIHAGIYSAIVDQCTEEDQALLDPYTKRWSPYVLKLAMLFQIAINPNEEIGYDAIVAGATVVEYAMESTIHLFKGDLGLSPFQRDCEKVLKYIAKRNGKITRKMLLSSKVLPGGTRDYDEVLIFLSEQGQLEVIPSITENRKDEQIILS